MIKKNKNKSYLLDTSVILDDPQNIEHIYQNGDNKIFVTDVVLSELNKKKDLSTETGFFARTFFRMLNGDNGKEIKSSLFGGSELEDDHIREMYLKFPDITIPIYVVYRPRYKTKYLEHGLNDARISEIAQDYKLTLLTNDIALKIQALAMDINAQSLHRDRVENPGDIDFFESVKLPVGFNTAELTDKDDFKSLSDWTIVEINEEDNTDSSKYLTGKKFFGLKIDGRFEEQKLDEMLEETKPYVRPINLEQKLYYSMLIHPKNKVTVATGSTGSGKTLIALQAGLHLMKKGVVDGIVYMRNTVTSNDKEAELGFRKGDESQKLGYFMYPLYSAINFTIESLQKESFAKKIEYSGDVNTIQKQAATEYFISKHNIEIVDIAHARGITIAKKFVIFDEAQNASNGTIKLIGTRMGNESRIVFLGDWAQIDHPYLTKQRNGLVTLLKKAQENDFIAGIQLRHTIRSDIANWFQENFN